MGAHGLRHGGLMGDETPRGRLARCRICASDGAGFGESGRGKGQEFWGAEIYSKISFFLLSFRVNLLSNCTRVVALISNSSTRMRTWME